MLLLLAGCTGSPDGPATGPVDVAVPAGAPAAPPSCARLLEALPDEVDPGVARRPVTGDATRTAAWGDPAITLVCGVAAPERLAEPVRINGVAWNVRDVGAARLWTLLEFEPVVDVTIPDAYENGAELVLPLAEPVETTLTRLFPKPEL